jgi:hypothetical protein
VLTCILNELHCSGDAVKSFRDRSQQGVAGVCESVAPNAAVGELEDLEALRS